MKIIDYSTQDLNSKFQISRRRRGSPKAANLKFQMVEVFAASLIFIIPVLALFILSK